MVEVNKSELQPKPDNKLPEVKPPVVTKPDPPKLLGKKEVKEVEPVPTASDVLLAMDSIVKLNSSDSSGHAKIMTALRELLTKMEG